jgi:hypothetical protein
MPKVTKADHCGLTLTGTKNVGNRRILEFGLYYRPCRNNQLSNREQYLLANRELLA